MPELPEVEAAARYLGAQIMGRTLRGLDWLHPSLVRTAPRSIDVLIGQRVTAVRRVAKWQEIEFAGGDVLVVHFRMTGDWAVTSSIEAPRHARAHFAFSGRTHVWLVDPRVLGRVELRAAGDPLPRSRTGPDALDPALDAATLRPRFASRGTPIKSVLLDQSVIAGVGNIYAAEALWHARISPTTPARQLSATRVTRLITGIRWTMELALAEQGRHQYRTATERLAVYDREGEPCLRCDSPIARITQAQRSTYFCRRCQRS